MQSEVRSLVFEPLTLGTLNQIIPSLCITLKGIEIHAPAQLKSSEDGRFVFELYFESGTPPKAFENGDGGYLTESDQVKLKGRIAGKIHFESDVFPTFSISENHGAGRGSSIVRVAAHELIITPTGYDTYTLQELDKIHGREIRKAQEHPPFSAHAIFHGPTLYINNGGTNRIKRNDFLGKATSENSDTHLFSGEGWEAALIQKGKELHLHARSIKESDLTVKNPEELLSRIISAVSFTHGFLPWPAYYELRVNQKVIERRVRPHFNLGQTYIAPLSARLGAEALGNPSSKLIHLIPTVVNGLSTLNNRQQERLRCLLWHVISVAIADSPLSTKRLILFAAFDGLIKVINDEYPEKPETEKSWTKASRKLGLSWETWTSKVFGLRGASGSERHALAHGELWIDEDKGFQNFPVMGCAFMAMVAALCGYEGPVVNNPFMPSSHEIANLRERKESDTRFQKQHRAKNSGWQRHSHRNRK